MWSSLLETIESATKSQLTACTKVIEKRMNYALSKHIEIEKDFYSEYDALCARIHDEENAS